VITQVQKPTTTSKRAKRLGMHKSDGLRGDSRQKQQRVQTEQPQPHRRQHQHHREQQQQQKQQKKRQQNSPQTPQPHIGGGATLYPASTYSCYAPAQVVSFPLSTTAPTAHSSPRASLMSRQEEDEERCPSGSAYVSSSHNGGLGGGGSGGSGSGGDGSGSGVAGGFGGCGLVDAGGGISGRSGVGGSGRTSGEGERWGRDMWVHTREGKVFLRFEEVSSVRRVSGGSVWLSCKVFVGLSSLFLSVSLFELPFGGTSKDFH
jgi:hypothetical protein